MVESVLNVSIQCKTENSDKMGILILLNTGPKYRWLLPLEFQTQNESVFKMCSVFGSPEFESPLHSVCAWQSNYLMIWKLN